MIILQDACFCIIENSFKFYPPLHDATLLSDLKSLDRRRINAALQWLLNDERLRAAVHVKTSRRSVFLN